MTYFVYAPAQGLATWRAGLADPKKHWVRTRSAFETAVFWELGARERRGLRKEVADLLDQEKRLKDCTAIAAFPEHCVHLPGGSRPSQNDVWAMLRNKAGLVSLAVEGKAGEPFGETIENWWGTAPSAGKKKRLAFLCKQLGLTADAQAVAQGCLPVALADLRYQLMHRSASAIIEADRIGAHAAVMLVLSFRPDPSSKSDFDNFCAHLNAQPSSNGSSLRECSAIGGLPLFLGWLDAPPCSDADVAKAVHWPPGTRISGTQPDASEGEL